MSKIVGKIKWIVEQCAAIALVALATNLLESAGALPSRSAAVTQPTLMTIVDRSGKGNRLVPGQRPGCGRNYERHNLREPNDSILCGEIKLLINGFRGQALPAIDFSHVDLSGSKQCPE